MPHQPKAARVVRHCMKTLYIIATLILEATFSSGQKQVTIIGEVLDQDAKVLKDVAIRISLDGGYCKETSTNNAGVFIFKEIQEEYWYVIEAKKANYMSKTDLYRPNTHSSKDTFFIDIILRQRKFALINTSEINDQDLGMTIEKAIHKFKIDTTECYIMDEPPGIANGVVAELGDSTTIYLRIASKSNFRGYYSNILGEKITGIGLAFPNCTKKEFGISPVWLEQNPSPYCQ